VIEHLTQRIYQFFEQERQLKYIPNGVGITSLLACKNKWLLKEKHPELSTKNVEIANGFIFEFFIKKIFEEWLGEQVVCEYTFTLNYKGLLINPHIDIVIFRKEAVYIVEIKSMKELRFKVFPEEDIITHKLVKKYEPELPEKYVKQVQLQKFFLSKHLDKQNITAYLFISAVARYKEKSKRVFLEYIPPDIEEEEVDKIIQDWHEKIPLYKWECQRCDYAKICDRFEV